MTSARSRNTAIDMAKGLLFVPVPLTHLIELTLNVTLFKTLAVMRTALMISWFALSGYTFATGRRSWAQNAGRRLKQLMLPWLLWTLADILLTVVLQAFSGSYSLSESLLGAWQAFGANYNLPIEMTTMAAYEFTIGQVAYWFLPQMFLASLIFLALADLTRKDVPLTLLAAAALLLLTGVTRHFLTDSLPFTVEETPAYAAALLLGCLAGRYRLLEQRPLKGVWFPVSLALCVVMLTLIRLTVTGSYEDWGTTDVSAPYVQILCAALTVYVSVFGMQALGNLCRPVGAAFQWLGRHTLDMLMVHMPVYVLLRRIPFLADRSTVGRCMVMLAADMVISILFCVARDRLTQRLRKKA